MFRLDADSEDTPAKKGTKKGEDPSQDPDAVVIVENSLSPYLVLFHEPTGYRAEQIRGLRNKLSAMNPDGSAKSLVVVSAGAGDGKTTTAINLAMAFAERERTPVVLVDGDMRKPAIERSLQLNPRPGLSDVLLGSVSLESALRPSGVRNLDVLGAGSKLAVPSEILTGHLVEELYDRLKENYQYVIVDSPAIKPVTDAGVLAGCADGTLFVVQLLQSSKGHTKDALRTIRELGANVLGTFVTAVRGDDPSQYGYGNFDTEDDEG